MNLQESDSFRDELEKNSKKKKLVVASIILCAILVVLLMALIVEIQRRDATTEKFFLDGTQISKPKDVYKDVEGVTYVNIEAFVELLKSSKSSSLKYTYLKGHYGLYDEDEKSCLIDNGYETLAVSADNKYYNKYIDQAAPSEATIAGIEVTLKSESGYSEKFTTENPMRYIDDKIYVPLENIPEMFNLRLDWQEYRKRIYSFENIVSSAIEQIAKLETTPVMSGAYENLKSLIYGYAILQDADEVHYGVLSLADGTDKLSSKYKDITFVQNVQEFYITADNGNMGLVSADGKVIIKTSEEYEKISLLDDDNQLYMVEKNSECGVINRAGKPIIYTEYDDIGFDTSKFTLDRIENDKLIAEKCIPVEKNKKFGLFNIDGEQILNTSFDGLGYISASKTAKAGEEESIVLIPKTEGVNGIVVNQGDLYGIFDIDSESLFLPCSFSKIFAVRKSGKINYYVEFNGSQYDLREYLEELGLAKNFDMIDKETEDTSKTSSDDVNTNTTDEKNLNNETNTNEDNSTIEVEL